MFPRLPLEPRVSSCTGCFLPATMPSCALRLRASMLKIYKLHFTNIPGKNRCNGLKFAGFLTFQTVTTNGNTYLSASIVCRGNVTTELWSTTTFALSSAQMLCPWPTLATLVIRRHHHATNYHIHSPSSHSPAIRLPACPTWQKQIHLDAITLIWFNNAC